MNHRPRFIIVTALLLAIAAAAWWAGVFNGIPALGRIEILMISALVVLFLIGQIAAIRGDWDTVAHIANVLPAWGLAATGLGLLLAISELHSLTPEAMSQVFRDLGYSIAPNIAGVMGFAWLRTVAWWSAREDI